MAGITQVITMNTASMFCAARRSPAYWSTSGIAASQLSAQGRERTAGAGCRFLR
ncbi:hypothetical protein KCP71_02525 [Salmonella enterica subsp. enterica]|nr:hypothetical protein KCP71_02525 [Salmonella enterica subsp. enterica]